jgi:acetyl-CoA C-acetyltransferase
MTDGHFAAEIVSVAGVDRDERPRPNMTATRLGRLPAAYREGGTVTAGNSCGINDGAAVLALARDAGGRPGLRILSTASTGVDPALPGIGLVPAVRTALRRADVRLDEIDVIEFNEAFAGQVLACCRDLDLDPQRVCPDGGALALGHPWGASGAVLGVRLFSQMIRDGRGELGLAAIAVGGGQGVAMVVEACR